MKVFLTGVNGFIGSRLAERLHRAGVSVAGSVRDRKTSPTPAWVATTHQIVLGEVFDPAILRGHDVLVHCAFAPGKANEQVNVDGAVAIARAATEEGVARQVFLSSFSAIPNATSGYGRMKYTLERWFEERGATIVRPGLVIGPGGLFARMTDLIRRFPVVPLPGGAKNRVPIIGTQGLMDSLQAVLARPDLRRANLCQVGRPTLRDILDATRRALARPCLFVPLPIVLCQTTLAVLSSVGIGLGIDSESLEGYRANPPDSFESDLDTLGFGEMTLDEMVGEAIR